MTTMTLLTAHPDPNSFTRALAAAYREGAEGAGLPVQTIEVSDLRFDPVLRGTFREQLPDEPDLARARAALEGAAHVGWFFPTWWAGVPAALKGLIDRLMLPGKAFIHEGGALPRGLFAGRSSRYVATMDSPAAWYWLAHHDALGGSFGRGTLKYIGFGPVDRTMIYRVRKLAAPARARWLERLALAGTRDAARLLKARRAAPASPARSR